GSTHFDTGQYPSRQSQTAPNGPIQNYGDPNDLIQFHDCPPDDYQSQGNQSQPNYQPQRNYQQQHTNYQVPPQHNYNSQNQGPQNYGVNGRCRNEQQFFSAPSAAPVAQGPFQIPG
ncbi:unnamed protein product, partial [Allacma fusca]